MWSLAAASTINGHNRYDPFLVPKSHFTYGSKTCFAHLNRHFTEIDLSINLVCLAVPLRNFECFYTLLSMSTWFLDHFHPFCPLSAICALFWPIFYVASSSPRLTWNPNESWPSSECVGRWPTRPEIPSKWPEFAQQVVSFSLYQNRKKLSSTKLPASKKNVICIGVYETSFKLAPVRLWPQAARKW